MVELLPVCVWSNGTVTDWLLPLPLNSRRTGMLFPSAQPITAPVSQLPSTLESHPDAPVVQGGFDWPSRFVCPSVKVVVAVYTPSLAVTVYWATKLLGSVTSSVKSPFASAVTW